MSSCLSGLRASFSDSDSLRAILAAKRPIETKDVESSYNLLKTVILTNPHKEKKKNILQSKLYLSRKSELNNVI